VNACVPAACTVAEVGETDTVTGWTVTVADADFDISSTELAVMVTVRLLAGALAGALYVAEVPVILLRVPAPEAGERVQVTPLLSESLVTVAVNACVPAACTVAEVGETETVIREPPAQPEVPAARRATKNIPANDSHVLSVMACLSFAFSAACGPLLIPWDRQVFAALSQERTSDQ